MRKITFLALLSLALSASAAELHVPAQHETIQSAIDASVDRDVVIVAPGTYSEALDMKGRKITLRSSGGAAVTILDGTGLDSSIIIALNRESHDTIVQGFTFRKGTGYLPRVCDIDDPKGGAIFVYRGAITVLDSVFEDNGRNDPVLGETVDSGGAIFACESGLTVKDSRFERNGAGNGGAIDVIAVSRQTVTIERSVFRANRGGNAGAVGLTMFSNTSAALADLFFERNEAAKGGGLLIDVRGAARASVVRSEFRNNVGRGHGGGLQARSSDSAALTLAGLTVDSNHSDNGAGMSLTASGNGVASVTDCSFSNGVASFGGGAILSASSNAFIDVTSCDFRNNDAGMGGGLFAMSMGGENPLIRIDGARLLDNVARYKSEVGFYNDLICFRDGREPEANGLFFGGGADLRTGAGGRILANSLVAGNDGMRAGGVHASTCNGGTVDLINDTIVDNEGSGVHLRFGLSSRPEYDRLGAMRLANSIVRGNSGDELLAERLDARSTPAVTYNNLEGSYPGAGNIDLPPSFVDAAARDYRLARGSACIDAGDSTLLDAPIDDADLAKRPRLIGVVDLGAYEYQPTAPRRRTSRP